MNVVPTKFWASLTFVDGNPRLPGWRPDFFYLDDATSGWLIWTTELSGDEWGLAPMNERTWLEVHQHKIKPGLEFRLQEGYRLIAEGKVLRVE